MKNDETFLAVVIELKKYCVFPRDRTVTANIQLRLLNRKSGGVHHVKKFDHKFGRDSHAKTVEDFMPWKDITRSSGFIQVRPTISQID